MLHACEHIFDHLLFLFLQRGQDVISRVPLHTSDSLWQRLSESCQTSHSRGLRWGQGWEGMHVEHEHKRTSIQTDSLHSQAKHPCRELREPLKNLFSLLSKMRVDRISVTRMI